MATSIFSVAVLVLATSLAAHAEASNEMSGQHLSDYKDFEKNWHQVTVRFRKDTGELRFIYANDKAWSVLSHGGTTYPDGAVFAKIAAVTEPDSSFASSLVPSGGRRYQLMVKDKTRYGSTDGWGYALFDSNGHTFPEDPVVTVQACAACHRIVKERGFVFSEPMHISPFVAGAASNSGHKAQQIKFLSGTAAALPAEVRKELPPDAKTVRLLQGQMREHLFQGTLDEIRPVLAEEAARTHEPAILLAKTNDRYSMVFEVPSATCATGTGFRGVHNILGKGEKYEVTFCAIKP